MSSGIRDFFDGLQSVLSTIKPIDIVDVLILAYVIYMLLKLIRETRAGQLLKGILLLVIGYWISKLIGILQK